jgi:hypothetical protein
MIDTVTFMVFFLFMLSLDIILYVWGVLGVFVILDFENYYSNGYHIGKRSRFISLPIVRFWFEIFRRLFYMPAYMTVLTFS